MIPSRSRSPKGRRTGYFGCRPLSLAQANYTTIMLRNIPNKYSRQMLIDQHLDGFLVDPIWRFPRLLAGEPPILKTWVQDGKTALTVWYLENLGYSYFFPEKVKEVKVEGVVQPAEVAFSRFPGADRLPVWTPGVTSCAAPLHRCAPQFDMFDE